METNRKVEASLEANEEAEDSRALPISQSESEADNDHSRALLNSQSESVLKMETFPGLYSRINQRTPRGNYFSNSIRGYRVVFL